MGKRTVAALVVIVGVVSYIAGAVLTIAYAALSMHRRRIGP